MLQPIPGTAWLMALQPRPSPPPRRRVARPSTSELERPHVALIRVCLEVACCMRPLEHLDARRFAGPVRRHAQAFRRRRVLAGPVRIRSAYAQQVAEIPPDEEEDAAPTCDYEVFGTALCAGQTFAFTGRLRGGRLYRLLALQILPRA
ncbi:hypothetical protein [Corynebacterium yudongzhengii]|uniref:hypothetical protein n=1 Tax=Corynebacterium yudongzhengii TaxID=2080740 RepID=UPI001304D445|nr:hypothetical protein [Corynebacterium yudongzhengii]